MQTLVLSLLALFLFIRATDTAWDGLIRQHKLQQQQQPAASLNDLPSCSVEIVESIPEDVTYPSCFPTHKSTFMAWLELLNRAENNVTIASFYWSLLREDVFNSSSAYQVSRGHFAVS